VIAWSCVCRYTDDTLVGSVALDKRRRALKDHAAA